MDKKPKIVIFIPGFIVDIETLELIPKILAEVQPEFSKAGWEIVISNYYRNKPTDLPLNIYARRVAAEIETIDPDAIILFSMAGTLIANKIPNIPVVIIEAPWYGVLRWQFRIINFLAKLKGLKGFPLGNASVQGMIRTSHYMKERDFAPSWANHALQINGSLGTFLLARIGNTFGKIHGIGKYVEFSNINHLELVRNPQVIQLVLKFLDSDIMKVDVSSSLED